MLDRLIKNIVPAAIGYVTGGATGSFRAFAESDRAQVKKKQDKQRAEQFRIDQQQLRNNDMEFRDTDILGRSTGGIIQQPSRTVNAGFGSGFGNFLSDVGQNILNPISSVFSQVRPFLTQQSSGQPAIATRTTLGGQESQQSGTNQAFLGGGANLLGQAARFLRTPAGSIGTGLLTGIGGSMLGSQQGGMRITRKMKSQYRTVLNLNQGNISLASDMLGVSEDMFIMVLLKRFRNDGPVVTKAALRKTKTTVRRLKSMCDMYDSLRPTATRRKSPMKRASTTLISNK
jgi:hypothetical protein